LWNNEFHEELSHVQVLLRLEFLHVLLYLDKSLFSLLL
jgi:hypothetical protein